MRREMPAEQKREAEHRQRLMKRAVSVLNRAALDIGSLNDMTGKPEADAELEKVLHHINYALRILR
jgi:acyl-CoA reductase-like NAD-dependent aldehyde dehydrogenase